MEKLGLTLEGGDEGPDLAAEEEVNSPVGLVMAIWNHAPKMKKAFAKEEIQWPISWPISKQCNMSSRAVGTLARSIHEQA